MSKRALIIMAHGSRRASANAEFFQLVEQVAQVEQAKGYYHCVQAALLEQAPPTLLQACADLPEGISHLDVYPLFFNQGRHVEKDIPAQVAEVMDAHPQWDVNLLNYFGSSQDLASLVANHLAQQAEPIA